MSDYAKAMIRAIIAWLLLALLVGAVVARWDATEGVGSPPGPHGVLRAGAGTLRDAHRSPASLPRQVCSDEKIRMLRTAEAIHRAGFPKTRGEDPARLLALARAQLDQCWRW